MAKNNAALQKAYRARQAANGKAIKFWLDNERYEKLRGKFPGKRGGIDWLAVCDAAMGYTVISDNDTVIKNDDTVMQLDDYTVSEKDDTVSKFETIETDWKSKPLKPIEPESRSDLLDIACERKESGEEGVKEIADDFNRLGWTPDKYPGRKKSSATEWTVKTLSQAILRHKN